jgi:hypothetical protein
MLSPTQHGSKRQQTPRQNKSIRLFRSENYVSLLTAWHDSFVLAKDASDFPHADVASMRDPPHHFWHGRGRRRLLFLMIRYAAAMRGWIRDIQMEPIAGH